jgi:hypothetical protein
MTKETFILWLNRYAEAVKELSWNGSQATGLEAHDHKLFWEKKRNVAREHLVGFHRDCVEAIQALQTMKGTKK